MVDPPSTASALEQALRLADRGQLDDALSLCDQAKKAEPTNPRVYFLLGLIHEARGRIELAMDNLNRAVYLQADYYEALLHLALLKARRGETGPAELLRRRAARVYKPEQT